MRTATGARRVGVTTPIGPIADFLQGFLGTQQAGIEARNDITVFIRNWYANRNPLVTRLDYVPVDRVDFINYAHKYRKRSTTLGATITTTSVTVLTLADASFLMNHDVLQIVDSATGNYEYAQVNGDPVSSTVVNVTRNVATDGSALNTNLGTGTNASTVYLLANSRLGSEIQQKGLTTIGTGTTQYCQTFQFPVDIGGSAQTARAQVFPGGVQTPFDFNMTVQLQNMVDDIENAFYYGVGLAPVDSTSTTAMMYGIEKLLVTNNIGPIANTTPVNAAAYTSTDFVRDTLYAARNGGGEPDILVVSVNFMQAFATWGQAIQRIPAGETTYGTPIKLYEAPFLHGVTIVEAPLLKPFTAIALTSSEVYIRNKRNPFWQPRGALGDRVQGDWIAELAINVVNESHHAMVAGITAFSAN